MSQLVCSVIVSGGDIADNEGLISAVDISVILTPRFGDIDPSVWLRNKERMT